MHCLIAVGGNQGLVVDRAREAIDWLSQNGVLRNARFSRWYRTSAIGIQTEDPFLNAAVQAETHLPPLELLEQCQQAERRAGRRPTRSWSPRPLDLDLVTCDSVCMNTPRLILPHPGCWFRRFVLDPVCDLDPEQCHPERGISFQDFQRRLMNRPIRIGICGGTRAQRSSLCESLAIHFPSDCVQSEIISRDFNRSDASGMQQLVDTYGMLAWIGPGENPDWPDLPRAVRYHLSGIRFSQQDELRYCVEGMLGDGIKRLVDS